MYWFENTQLTKCFFLNSILLSMRVFQLFTIFLEYDVEALQIVENEKN